MANVRESDTRGLVDLREMLYDVTEISGTCEAFHEKRGGFYQHISYGRFRDEVEALGTELRHTLPHGARVLVVGKSGYLWALSFLALSCGGFTPLLVDELLSGEALIAIAKEARAEAVLCDAATLTRLSPMTDLPLLSFDTLGARIARGRAAVLAGDTGFGEAPLADAAAFYTSDGTDIKGAVFSHQCICAALEALREAFPLSCADIFLSVLPLSNAFECVMGLLLPLSRGASVAFGEGLGSLMRNMREIHPTHMVTVPYLAERIYDKFWQLVKDSHKETATRRAIAISDPVRPLSARQSLKEKLLAAAREPFGGSLHTVLVVGGTLSGAVCKGLRQVGIFAAQGYGVLECAGLAAVATREGYCDGTAGKPLPSVTVDIAGEQSDGRGEICLRGDSMALGCTAKDGRLYTGDFGAIDEDGFLHVIGKRKNCIERAGGILVSPEELEAAIEQSPVVKEAAVVGVLNQEEGDRELVALIRPNDAYIVELLGKKPDESEREGVVFEWLCELNAALPEHARIASFALTDNTLPRNHAGYILRAKLTAELEAAEQKNRRDQ